MIKYFYVYYLNTHPNTTISHLNNHQICDIRKHPATEVDI
jgi:hypothetical protein